MRVIKAASNLFLKKRRLVFAAIAVFIILASAMPLVLPSRAAAEATPSTVSNAQAGAAAHYPPAPVLEAKDYPRAGGANGRVVVWMAAQMHLWFAAFVLAVPIFAVIMEAAGIFSGDARYDGVAHEFMRVSLTAYSLTAMTGGLLLIGLFLFYPGVMVYLSSIFKPTALIYALLIIFENAVLLAYYYGWERMREGKKKLAHLGLGILLNAMGTAMMFVANAWVTFMMSPAGVDMRGSFDGNVWHAVHNHLWNPMNLHRFIANISYGGSIIGAYAAYRFLSSTTAEERAHYDWMGYSASLIAIGALLPLPFAGYWLTAEIYAYSQQMGMNLMGGVFAWLFIVQAVLIGALFLAANYYLWCGLERGGEGKRYVKYVKYIAFAVAVSFMVWFTPHTLVLRPAEAKALGGPYHPYIGPLGLMPAKNIAVNVMLIFTFLSFLMYRRSGRTATASWAGTGNAIEAAIVSAALINITFLGVYYGYYTNSVYKVASSVPQVASTMFVMVSCLVIDYFMYRGGRRAEGFKWGNVPERSQYALILITVSFTWLMGLMGFVRSAIRQGWHVYSVMKDNSPDAYTPSIAYAAKVVSVGTAAFLGLVVFIFWLSHARGLKAGRGGRR